MCQWGKKQTSKRKLFHSCQAIPIHWDGHEGGILDLSPMRHLGMFEAVQQMDDNRMPPDVLYFVFDKYVNN